MPHQILKTPSRCLLLALGGTASKDGCSRGAWGGAQHSPPARCTDLRRFCWLPKESAGFPSFPKFLLSLEME